MCRGCLPSQRLFAVKVCDKASKTVPKMDDSQEPRTDSALPSPTSDIEPSTTHVLRRTHFMGSPLLVNEPVMAMSAIAYPSDSPTAADFAAFHPNIGRVETRGGRRHSLFLRLGKDAIDTKVYQKPETPHTSPSSDTSSLKKGIVYESFSGGSVRFPKMRSKDNLRSRSGLFTTPPSSPIGRRPYEAYSASATVSSRPRKSAPKPILTVSVDDLDYAFIDMVSPSPSPAISIDTPPSRKTNNERKFSFDANATPDWEIVEANALQRSGLAASTADMPPSPITAFLSGQPATQITALADETFLPQTPVPLPTTRFYNSAFYAFGRFTSRRQTPHGTVKLHYQHVTGLGDDHEDFKD